MYKIIDWATGKKTGTGHEIQVETRSDGRCVFWYRMSGDTGPNDIRRMCIASVSTTASTVTKLYFLRWLTGDDEVGDVRRELKYKAEDNIIAALEAEFANR